MMKIYTYIKGFFNSFAHLQLLHWHEYFGLGVIIRANSTIMTTRWMEL